MPPNVIIPSLVIVASASCEGGKPWRRDSFFEALVSAERGPGGAAHSQKWQRAEMPQEHA